MEKKEEKRKGKVSYKFTTSFDTRIKIFCEIDM